MVKLLAILAVLIAMGSLASLPWVSAVLYAAFSILQPQHVWFWAFDGSIPFFSILATLTLLSWLIQAKKKNINYKIYSLPINKALLLLTVLINASNWFASYSGGIASSLITEIFNTTMLIYFASVALINNEKAIRYLTYGFIFTAVYYGYDANMAYFDNNWGRFVQGRLIGPITGAYNDNNKFAIIMVIGFPFLLLGFFYFKKLAVRAFMVLGMLWVLHGIFLTGSRGALLAVAVAVLISTRVISLSGFKKFLVMVAILVAFAFVVDQQAGKTLQRSDEVTENSDNEQAVNPRILSWQVGYKLFKNHPILGVGVYRFRVASAIEFPGESPHVAHNTFITFATENGLLAGLLYLYTFWTSFRMLRKINKVTDKDSITKYAANSAFAALGGFFVGALFLDMLVFEPYYYLLLLLTACYFQATTANKGDNALNTEKTKNV